MNLDTLKQQIVATVDASQNEELLQDVFDILSQPYSHEMEAYHKKRIEESIQQADEGKVISNENVHQLAHSWITK